MAAKESSGNGTPAVWKWVAAVMVALLLGLVPFLVSSRSAATREQVEEGNAAVALLNERLARTEEQILSLVAQAQENAESLSAQTAANTERIAALEQQIAGLVAIIEAQASSDEGGGQ